MQNFRRENRLFCSDKTYANAVGAEEKNIAARMWGLIPSLENQLEQLGQCVFFLSAILRDLCRCKGLEFAEVAIEKWLELYS